MVKRPNHRKNKNKKKGKQSPSRERHYLSFREKSVLQIIALLIAIGSIAIAYMMDIRLMASASSPGLSLRRTLSWESIQLLTNFSDFKTWLFSIQALIVVLLIFAFLVTVCNFWVQWTWHELRTLFFSQDKGQEEVEA